jgi:glycosyltransferase involved in cell wall biosynthesis
VEAMAMGIPCIGTGWGGNTEYMNAGNAFLVGYEVQPVDHYALAEFPSYSGHSWAEPDFNDLRQKMRLVREDDHIRTARAAQGLLDVRSQFSPLRVARLMIDRSRQLLAAAS